MTFTFRTALPSEFTDADRVLRAAFTPYLARLGRDIPADYYKWLPASIERGDVFVAEEGGRVVGVAATERREAELFLDRLAVDPSKQGTGLGRWLLQRLDEVARSRGDRSLSLITAEMMDHLIKLYSGHGFEIVHRGPPDHGKDAHMRVHMVKRL
ncbi:MAG: N-acetyltransferase GCN5 [Rhodospirillaceae bacterium]|nr:MAG: N-acetyltransferase GCN5 [Rhodospirillaceae bacterium]